MCNMRQIISKAVQTKLTFRILDLDVMSCQINI